MLEKLLFWRYSSVILVDLGQLAIETIFVRKISFFIVIFCSNNFSINYYKVHNIFCNDTWGPFSFRELRLFAPLTIQ